MPKLATTSLCIATEGGRTLIRDLNMRIGCERVAIVGRNGVGKSVLLRTLAGAEEPSSGQVHCDGSRFHVPQNIPEGTQSGGERRRAMLEEAMASQADFLLLDEPSEDLDAEAMAWLLEQLRRRSGGLLVVSHAPAVLAEFSDFFVVSESGCRYVRGVFTDILASLDAFEERKKARYQRRLRTLVQEERRSDVVARRRLRKKQVGRVREVGRAPARALLNSKRSYAQESQGKRAVLGRRRIAAKRDGMREARTALRPALPLTAVMPSHIESKTFPEIEAQGLGKWIGGRCLFRDLSFTLARQRMCITGPNGAGKTTLLRILAGELQPTEGHVVRNDARLGAIGQGAPRWMREESLCEELLIGSAVAGEDEAFELLAAHRFPLGLAERPLASLSPGERFRAALIALVTQRPSPEFLLLDEPTRSLDRLGAAALTEVLQQWPGGLIVASHDQRLLSALEFDVHLELPLHTTDSSESPACAPPQGPHREGEETPDSAPRS